MSSCLICHETSFRALEKKFNDIIEGNDIGLRSTIKDALLWISKSDPDYDDEATFFDEFPTSFVGTRFRKCKRPWREDQPDRCVIVELYYRFNDNKISKRWMRDFQSWWYISFDGEDALFFELYKTDINGTTKLIWADWRDAYEMSEASIIPFLKNAD